MQCLAVITQSISPQTLTKDISQLAREWEVWDAFCEFDLWLSCVPVAAVLYTEYFTELLYNGARLYYQYGMGWLNSQIYNQISPKKILDYDYCTRFEHEFADIYGAIICVCVFLERLEAG